MAYGGPPTTPDKPTPESTKLTESVALTEFVADLFPSAGLRPTDPVQLARARAFALSFENLITAPFRAFLAEGAPADELFQKLELLQAQLPPVEDEAKLGGPFVAGKWSIGDAIVVPFLIRLPVLWEREVGKYALGEGKKALEVLKSARFARLWKYIEDGGARESVKKTWDAVSCPDLASCPFEGVNRWVIGRDDGLLWQSLPTGVSERAAYKMLAVVQYTISSPMVACAIVHRISNPRRQQYLTSHYFCAEHQAFNQTAARSARLC